MAFYESLGHLSAKQRSAIGILVLVAIFALFFYFVYWTNKQEIDLLAESLATKQRTIAKYQIVEKNVPKLEAEVKRAQEQLDIAIVLIPESKEIPKLLADITNLGSELGLEFTRFTPGPEAERDFYAEVPITLQANGTFHDTVTFFDRIGKLNRIVMVTGVHISNPKFVDNMVTVTTDFVAVTYKFLERGGS